MYICLVQLRYHRLILDRESYVTACRRAFDNLVASFIQNNTVNGCTTIGLITGLELFSTFPYLLFTLSIVYEKIKNSSSTWMKSTFFCYLICYAFHECRNATTTKHQGKFAVCRVTTLSLSHCRSVIYEVQIWCLGPKACTSL